MKKISLLIVAASLAAISSCGNKVPENPKFDVVALPHATLYVYNTGDVMSDASFIVEGKKGLVTMETPLFKENLTEFEQYVKALKKPVVAEIVDFHVGGTADRPVVMAEGMGSFTKNGVYAAMMAGFQQSFGDAMVSLPTGEVTEVPFGETTKLAGVDFTFNHESSVDFPGAAILIDGTAILNHWAPVKAHISNLEISSREGIDAEIALWNAEKATGAKYFLGGHGGIADTEALEFRLSYLVKVKALLETSEDAASFAAALKEAYPGLAGEANVEALAEALYK